VPEELQLLNRPWAHLCPIRCGPLYPSDY